MFKVRANLSAAHEPTLKPMDHLGYLAIQAAAGSATTGELAPKIEGHTTIPGYRPPSPARGHTIDT